MGKSIPHKKRFSMLSYMLEEISIIFIKFNFIFLTDSTDFKKPYECKAKILLLTYAKFAYIQNLRINANHYHVYRVYSRHLTYQ